MPGTRMLELRLRDDATPRRVARATRLLADMVECAFPREAQRMTLVVENRQTRAYLKAWSPDAKGALSSMRRFIESPSAEGLEFDARAVADVLIEYGRDEIDAGPAFWKPRARKPFRELTRDFMEHLGVVSKALPPVGDPAEIRGTTTVICEVLRVGRTRGSAAIKARLEIPGQGVLEVDVDDERGALAGLCDAMRDGRSVKVKLRAVWMRVDDALVLSHRGAVATKVSPASRLKGPALVEMLGTKPTITIADYRAAFGEEEPG